MNTVIELARQQADDLQAKLAAFVRTHCDIRWSGLNDGGGVVFLGRDYDWTPLADAGRRAQACLTSEYRLWIEALGVLLSDQPEEVRRRQRECDAVVQRVLTQDGLFLTADREHVLAGALEALSGQTKLLDYLPGDNTEPVLVPDTNALLYNHHVDAWRFTECPRFRLVLTPTVVGELDEKKMHRNQSVQRKAESLIRQVGDWRRRGRLTEGVPLVSGVSTVIAVAKEPRFEKTLPWLDPTNADDRLIASTLEVIRANPRAPVCLVTRDVNAQNKAEMARIPMLPPPEPSKQLAAKKPATAKS